MQRFAPALLLAVAALVAVPAARADDFYKTHQIKLLIGNNVGTSYDLTARLVGRHMHRHIPGRPSIVAQNMPGATGLIAANFAFNRAPKDGSVLAAAHQSLPLRQIFGDKHVKYDAARIEWIGSPQASVALITTWHASPVKTIEDAKTKTAVMGATTSRASAAIVVALANNLIGTKFSIALGYRGNHIDLAMERGEVAGRAGQSWAGWKSVRPDWIRDGKINVLAQLGLKRDPELTNVPLMTDLAQNDEARKILLLYSQQIALGRPLYVVPEVPKARIAVLRAAFDATMTDPAFLADAKKLNHEVSPTPGIELNKIVTDIMATPKSLLARAEQATTYGSGYTSCDKLSGAKACRKKKKKKKKKKNQG